MTIKARITDRDARESVDYAIGYCEAQYLLKFFSPLYYTAGTYGRKSDIYYIDGVYYATGYGPQGERLDYDTVRKYDRLAEKLEGTRDEKREQARELLAQMVEESNAKNQ